MLATSSYTWLLLLTICCLHCMALKENGKKQVPAHSSHSEEASSHSEEASSYSGEASSDSEEGSSDSEEGSSHSEEGSSHSEEGSSHSGEASSDSEEGSSYSEEVSSEHKVPTCTDRKKNQGETDIDCGGKKCAKCADGKKCKVNPDCISGSCKSKICAQQSTKPTKPAETTTTTTTTATTATTTTTTTTPQPTTITTTTTTPQPTTTTETTNEPATATETTIMPICEPACKNDGICTGNDVCTCTTGFSGPTCEVQSVGLCLNSETFNAEPILLITFGSGSAQYFTATPNDFDFNTTYQQRFEPTTNDGMFSFVNLVNENSAWHTDATDHTGNDGGYMYLVNADFKPGQFYNGRVDNLCIGLRYEFSVYLANLCKPSGRINPNVLFEVRSTDENVLLAQLNSGDIVEHETLTWEKYGFSFIAPSSSVNLLMISNALGGNGNDIVIDDIALRVCAHEGSGFCPSN